MQINNKEQDKWQFWVDRGGTFTDIVSRHPDGSMSSHKLLSENPEQYQDAAIEGIRNILQLGPEEAIPTQHIDAIKMGTTVATNALLERQGQATLLAITKGHKDALRIGYQNRPQLFALDIELPDMLYNQAIEITERMSAQGEVITELDSQQAQADLQTAYDQGLRSVAIVLMHGYRYTQHERILANIAKQIGFTQISTSHQTSPLMKLVSRGDTTVADAYLSPILRHYVAQVDEALHNQHDTTRLMFMQSNGGLTEAHHFQGKDAILSGPAGGVVGMVKTGAAAGEEQLIGFDMGGTSTDVSHYAGTYERAFETEVAGVRLRAPMMQIHTVAAGGGSILHFDGARMRVGPDSAGSHPGPACYGKGGPLTITDCNVLLGKLAPEHFPKLFGPQGDQALDAKLVTQRFQKLTNTINQDTGQAHSPQQIAEGFLAIAVANMANAIKKISVQKGYDVSRYTLACFGGAGGQHACLVADSLGMEKILLHPFAGVLSAFGIGLADTRQLLDKAIEAPLETDLLANLANDFAHLQQQAQAKLLEQGIHSQQIRFERRLHLRYTGSDTALTVPMSKHIETVTQAFAQQHQTRFGFTNTDKQLIVEALQLEAIGVNEQSLESPNTAAQTNQAKAPDAIISQPIFCANAEHQASFIERQALIVGTPILGPAVVLEATSTIVIEPGWQATKQTDGNLLLERVIARPQTFAMGTQADPVMLEIFNNLFMNIAEQMGTVLENTAVSVNIKERLDFSCAIFSPTGELVANAPHMPVHLGSMGESIKTVIREQGHNMDAGDVFVLNAPYNGGTHLPDVTVIKPIHDAAGNEVLFYVASRGHHADIGGITPGSAPANSTHVEQEGILLNNIKLVSKGVFNEQQIRDLLLSGPYPARNIEVNIADLQAQIAASEKGAAELIKIINQYSLPVVHAYMQHVQANAEEAVRRVLATLNDCAYTYAMDDGHQVTVNITVNQAERSAIVDFTGTSSQHPGNVNAPHAICHAAVLYVLRCLVEDDIPLNGGCLNPVDIIIPEASLINPQYPAAVIAGNTETSQLLVDTLFAALSKVAGAQGTMNNFIYGNDTFQNYETICGGAGATANADGCSAVHTHMTNSRMTDPEVLEWRFPVRLEEFSVRTNTGGAGRHKGGDGVTRKLRFLEPMTVNLITGHRINPTYALAGGQPGGLGKNWLERADASRQQLAGIDQVDIQINDMVVIQTPGGGGYGKPQTYQQHKNTAGE